MNKENIHRIKVLINQLQKTRSHIETMIRELQVELNEGIKDENKNK
jgi:chaperonin cofactor prefoldin